MYINPGGNFGPSSSGGGVGSANAALFDFPTSTPDFDLEVAVVAEAFILPDLKAPLGDFSGSSAKTLRTVIRRTLYQFDLPILILLHSTGKLTDFGCKYFGQAFLAHIYIYI